MKKFFLIATIPFSLSVKGQNHANRIVIQTDVSILSKFTNKDTAGLKTLRVYFWGDSTRTNSVDLEPITTEGKLKWIINTKKSVLFTGNRLFDPFYMAQPGDSVYMSLQGGDMKFSGRGFDKYQLLYEIDKAKKNVTKPTKYVVDVESMDDYLKVDKYYYDVQLAKVMPLIETYSKKVSPPDLTWIKRWTVEWIEWERLNAFSNIAFSIARSTSPGSPKYSMDDVHKIWDSTQFKPWAKWLRNQDDYNNLGSPLYFYHFNRSEVWLKYDYSATNDSLASKPIRTYLYYEGIKRNYKGLVRERVLNYLIDEQVILEMGTGHKMTKALLKDYYSLTGFPTYKKWIKQLEIRNDAKWADNWAPPFELTDVSGNTYTKNKLDGKIGVIDFWFTGCKGCVQMAPALSKVEEHFKKDTNIVFLGISIDANKEQWLKSIREKKYTSGTGTQLYTSGKGSAHSMIKQYEIQSYPTMVLIDQYGKLIVSHPPPDARENNGKNLTELIQQQLLLQQDGPYVLYNNQSVKTYTINAKTVQQEEVNNQAPITITSATDIYDKPLRIELQKNLSVPPTEYAAPGKLLLLSDIEGNLSAFRKLLQANGVIDENLNWIFGNGHLAFVGDMFDRGEQVTECLWLIYSLEEKAKATGGYVHFILGNHEVMNLQGNQKYNVEKYNNTAVVLNKSITELYSENSELGRWLRTKNIMEKIGNLLLTHGGTSPAINRLPLTIQQINETARPYYAKTRDKYITNDVQVIMGNEGPLWYRGFYLDGGSEAPRISASQIDSLLLKFRVNHIITGHTIVADTISMHFGGKIINTDTRHARGQSEALFIEGHKFYRVNQEGERQLLLITNAQREITVTKN